MTEKKHSLKVSEGVYLDLRQFQRPRETLSQVIDRLIQVSIIILKVEPLLKNHAEHLEQRRAEEAKKERAMDPP